MNRFSLGLARLFMRTIGRTSEGIRLCFVYGLTSGKAVDYIYRNRPSGRWLIGPMIDRQFLAHPGWEAVRIRRRHLEQLLREAIEGVRRLGHPISLVDIASGPALYILSVLTQTGEQEVTARCRDLDERWLQEGTREAHRRGLTCVRFEHGDAFDRDSLLTLRPRPNIAVSSGFYDWFTDDADVQRSLAILYEMLEPGGRLVVTNQMSHPNLAFVSAVFIGFNKQPLRMTMRSAEHMRGMLATAGFTVERTLADAWGYYSVMTACKP